MNQVAKNPPTAPAAAGGSQQQLSHGERLRAALLACLGTRSDIEPWDSDHIRAGLQEFKLFPSKQEIREQMRFLVQAGFVITDQNPEEDRGGGFEPKFMLRGEGRNFDLERSVMKAAALLELVTDKLGEFITQNDGDRLATGDDLASGLAFVAVDVADELRQNYQTEWFLHKHRRFE